MTNRTVMAARVGPASLRSEPRNVFICAPVAQTTSVDHQEMINAVLKKVIRCNDRLLYPSDVANADPVVAFAERYGLFADPIVDPTAGESKPDLIIVIVDPRGDNALATPARALATQRRADLIITELPVTFA